MRKLRSLLRQRPPTRTLNLPPLTNHILISSRIIRPHQNHHAVLLRKLRPTINLPIFIHIRVNLHIQIPLQLPPWLPTTKMCQPTRRTMPHRIPLPNRLNPPPTCFHNGMHRLDIHLRQIPPFQILNQKIRPIHPPPLIRHTIQSLQKLPQRLNAKRMPLRSRTTIIIIMILKSLTVLQSQRNTTFFFRIAIKQLHQTMHLPNLLRTLPHTRHQLESNFNQPISHKHRPPH